MSKPLVLTCDIGTQSARALLVDPDGRIVDVVQSKYAEPYFSKEPGWAEQKPNFYFDRLCECCRELCARSNALLPDVIAMTITVIRDTVVCLDANNEPLRDIILWLDKRTVDPNGAMPAKNMMLFKVAGMEPTAKVVYAASVGNWIMRHEPEIWARTAKYVMLPTYLNYKLTGNLIDSASNQIGHIPFDYKNRRWMKPGSLTRCFCDVPNEKLCDLVPSGTVIGTVTDEVCALTGIPAGLPRPARTRAARRSASPSSIPTRRPSRWARRPPSSSARPSTSSRSSFCPPTPACSTTTTIPRSRSTAACGCCRGS